MHKDLESLAKLARDQGWTVEEMGGKVWWRPTNGLPVFTSSNHPHSVTTFRNIKAALAQRGLLDNAQLQAERRRQNKIEALLRDMLSPENLERAIRGIPEIWNDPGWEWRLFSKRDWRLLARFLATNIVDNHGGKIDRKSSVFANISPTCPKCGKQFAHISARFRHDAKCVRKPGAIETMVTEIVDPVEPDGETVKCPECELRFLKSEAQERYDHMLGEHGVVECPACLRVMKPGSLDVHLQNNCPVVNQGEKGSIKRGRKYRENQTVAAQPTSGQTQPPTVPTPPTGASQAPPPKVASTTTSLANDEETLWSLLEIVLDGPVQLNRQTLTVVNEWMEATAKLRDLVTSQRK